MTENMNDSSFMVPNGSYQQDAMPDLHRQEHHNVIKNENDQNGTHMNHVNLERVNLDQQQQRTESNNASDIVSNANQHTIDEDHQQSTNDESSKSGKKRNKAAKKNTKLDAKSKLEKSRQSARECRARKKLRYQYLEDLVCNREKAVIKLREELSMFCEFSKQIDAGTLSDRDRLLLTDQTKENNSESTSLL